LLETVKVFLGGSSDFVDGFSADLELTNIYQIDIFANRNYFQTYRGSLLFDGVDKFHLRYALSGRGFTGSLNYGRTIEVVSQDVVFYVVGEEQVIDKGRTSLLFIV